MRQCFFISMRNTVFGVIVMWKRKQQSAVFPEIPAIRERLKKLPEPIVTDPNGSYTGKPLDPNERPVQDADDL